MSFKRTNTNINSDPFGDKEYYRLFKKLYSPLCRYCTKFIHNRDVAEDIVQEQFVYLWENWKRLSEIKSLESYIYKSVKNKSLNHLQYWYSRNTSPITSELIDTKLSIRHSDPSEILENKELSDILNAAIENLPEKCRIIFALKRFGNMSNLEISEKLQISVKTVEAQTTIALKKLKSALTAKWDIVFMLLIHFTIHFTLLFI